MYKIAFFGASVTEQSHPGYTGIFKDLVNKNKIDAEIFVHGYGSMHLFDAGICFLDYIIINKPDFCFIDWFSSDFISVNIEHYLDTIVYKLIKANNQCKIYFLLLERSDMSKERLEMYNMVKEYANKKNIYYIELYNKVNFNEILRDSVHTNEQGCIFYGTEIFEYFKKTLLNNTLQIPSIVKTYLSDIRMIDCNKIYKNKVIIKGNAEIIGIYQLIGPYSPKVQLIIDNNDIKYETIWDQWCYFERRCVKINLKIKEKLIINILNEEFDRSSAKTQLEWHQYEKYLNLNKIFFVGDSLILDEVNSA